MSKNIVLDEKAIDYLEAQIPELAKLAVKKAYVDALSSGWNVLTVEEDTLLEVSPNGSKKVVKHLSPSLRVIPGQVIEIKW